LKSLLAANYTQTFLTTTIPVNLSNPLHRHFFLEFLTSLYKFAFRTQTSFRSTIEPTNTNIFFPPQAARTPPNPPIPRLTEVFSLDFSPPFHPIPVELPNVHLHRVGTPAWLIQFPPPKPVPITIPAYKLTNPTLKQILTFPYNQPSQNPQPNQPPPTPLPESKHYQRVYRALKRINTTIAPENNPRVATVTGALPPKAKFLNRYCFINTFYTKILISFQQLTL